MTWYSNRLESARVGGGRWQECHKPSSAVIWLSQTLLSRICGEVLLPTSPPPLQTVARRTKAESSALNPVRKDIGCLLTLIIENRTTKSSLK